MSIYKGSKKIAGLYRGEDISHATTEHAGIAQVAKETDVFNGIGTNTIVTPEALKHLMNFHAVNRVSSYLYTMDASTTNSDYDYAIEFYKHNSPRSALGACSSVRNGSFYGRNYDWYYSNNTSFVVTSRACEGRYASIGVASVAISEDVAKASEWNELYRIVPFSLLDGINEYGVVCSINVVPTAYGETSGKGTEKSYCASMLPKYILDHCKTAVEAKNWLLRADIYAPIVNNTRKEIHVMVSDANKTYVVEFINNEAVAYDVTDKPYLTNFHIHETSLDATGHIDYSTVEQYGNGLERYNSIIDNYTSASTKDGMRVLMDSLDYTKTYKNLNNPNKVWLTEFADSYGDQGLPFGNLTINDTYETYSESALLSVVATNWSNRTRDDGNTWFTVHSAVYDITSKQLYLKVQLGEPGFNKEYHFSFNDNASINAAIDLKQDKLVAGEGISITDNVISVLDIDFSAYATKELLEAELNKKADKGDYVEYLGFNGNRKTIQLDNYNSISGIDTKGVGHNLVMLSKWDVADFGATGVHFNLNTKDNVTINDNKIVATVDDIETAVEGVAKEADVNAKLETKADKGDYIEYKQFAEGRKTVELANHNTISGLATDGVGHNLVMLSKWNVADFGAVGVHCNLNTSDKVTINDKETVLTDGGLNIDHTIWNNFLAWLSVDGNLAALIGTVEDNPTDIHYEDLIEEELTEPAGSDSNKVSDND